MTLMALAVAKVTAVLALSLAATAFARGRSAAVRHWILASGIACALAVPLLPAITPLPTPRPREAVPAPQPDVTTSFTIAAPGAPAGDAWSGPAVAQLLAAVWATGSLVTGLLLAAGCLRLRRITREATPARGAWAALSGHAAFLETPRPSLLVTWGARRPVVLLPGGASSWPRDRVRIVAAHELAHVERHDWAIQMLGEALRIVYWFHPLAWIVCQRLRLESERACDDAVLRAGVGGTDYASHLIDVARAFSAHHPPRVPAPAIAPSSTLQLRIRAMLNTRLDRRAITRSSRSLLSGIMLALTLAVAAIGAQGTATLSGSVSDPMGRPVPGVTITLANPAMNLSVETKSNDAGAFEVPVVAGQYRLEAKRPGFANLTREVNLAAGRSEQVSLALSIGTLQETINVTGPATSPGRSRPKPARKPCTPSAAGGQITPPLKYRDVRPEYPGPVTEPVVVTLDATLGLDGSVQDVRATSTTAPEFEAAAMAAVRQWGFTETLLNCEPVEVKMRVTVTFKN